MPGQIYLAPLGFSNSSLLESIAGQIELFLPTKVESISLPIDEQESYSSERGQYYSTKLISMALPFAGQYKGKILMLVEFDLYIPVLTYVFGEAMLGGDISIVSVCRLHEEFYTGTSDDKLLQERTMKEVFHELGHNFGLYHCSDWGCAMHSSSGIEEVDIKGAEYCSECKSTVLSALS